MEQADKSPDQKAAESDVDSFKQLLGPFVVAAEKTRMAMVFTNARTAENLIVFANASFLELSGYESKDVLGESLNALMARGTDPAEKTAACAASTAETNSSWRLSHRCVSGRSRVPVTIPPIMSEIGKS